jgi:hypothetical protein
VHRLSGHAWFGAVSGHRVLGRLALERGARLHHRHRKRDRRTRVIGFYCAFCTMYVVTIS